jgi:hypothetical protein
VMFSLSNTTQNPTLVIESIIALRSRDMYDIGNPNRNSGLHRLNLRGERIRVN